MVNLENQNLICENRQKYLDILMIVCDYLNIFKLKIIIFIFIIRNLMGFCQEKFPRLLLIYFMFVLRSRKR
jgi:hypothetical protein